LILALHDTKKAAIDSRGGNQNLVDFMGIILKGLNFTDRIKDNTDYNLTNIQLAEHFNNNKKNETN